MAFAFLDIPRFQTDRPPTYLSSIPLVSSGYLAAGRNVT